jgi:hypothetical protein
MDEIEREHREKKQREFNTYLEQIKKNAKKTMKGIQEQVRKEVEKEFATKGAANEKTKK